MPTDIHTVLTRPQSLIGRPVLLAGTELVRVQEGRDVLRAAARAAGFVQIERVDASEKKFDWDSLLAVCMSPGLFASRRLVDLRLAQCKLPAAASKLLIDAFENPDPDLQWLISAPDWSRLAERENWVQVLGRKGSVVGLWPLRAQELSNWVVRQAGQRGLQLDGDAVELLLWRTEGNLLATAMELDKLVLAVRDGHWDAASLDTCVADSARFDVFKLLDEAIYGNAARMRRVLRALRLEGTQAASLLPWMVRQLQLMHELASLPGGRAPSDQWLRAHSLFTPRSGQYVRAAKRHSAQQWERLWLDLEHLDRLSKGYAEGSAWMAMERLLLRVALSDADAQRFAA